MKNALKSPVFLPFLDGLAYPSSFQPKLIPGSPVHGYTVPGYADYPDIFGEV